MHRRRDGTQALGSLDYRPAATRPCNLMPAGGRTPLPRPSMHPRIDWRRRAGHWRAGPRARRLATSALGLCCAAALARPASVQLSIGSPTRADQAQASAPAASAPTARALSSELLLLERVRREALLETARALVACGPRMGGTPSGERASALLAAAFERAGLAVRLQQAPERWCHHEPSWSLRALAAARPGEASAPPPLVLASAWPYGFSPAAAGRAPLALEARAGCAQLTGERVRGRARASSPVLVLDDRATTEDGLHARVRELAARPDNPFPVFGINKPEGEQLRAWLAQERSVELEYALDARIERASPRTVIGVLPARAGAPEGHVLVCAHGDSDAGGPGANDNASGAAIVLEMARAYAQAVSAGELPPPARELRFAIWGTEIASSRAYLAALAEDPSPLLCVLNYDQAGYSSGADALYLEPDDLPANEPFVRALCDGLAQRAGTHGLPPRFASTRSQGGTDSYVFSSDAALAQRGVPALTLYASAWERTRELERSPGMRGESWSERERVEVVGDLHYHSAGDTPENTFEREPQHMEWGARAGLLALLLWQESLP